MTIQIGLIHPDVRPLDGRRGTPLGAFIKPSDLQDNFSAAMAEPERLLVAIEIRDPASTFAGLSAEQARAVAAMLVKNAEILETMVAGSLLRKGRQSS